MEYSNRDLQSSDGRKLLLDHLRNLQANNKEGSSSWINVQQQIDQIVAERFLDYLNR
jgi:hypothetical protein